MSWTVCKDMDVYNRAWSLARGSYQRGIINGIENLSGSTLKGKAKLFSCRYCASRHNLLARLRAAGISVGETTGPHNRRILVIG